MNSLDVADQTKSGVLKRLISLKPPDTNGLLLNIYQTSPRKSVRFIYCDFQSNGNLLALANNDAQIYLIDFAMGKCWTLAKLDSCTCIKLSDYNAGHIIVGKSNGELDILNIDSGKVLAKLFGHDNPVITVSFAQNNVCLSASENEALIWDLNSFSKLQILSLEKNCVLKFANFVPISNHILICYQDDIIQIWQNGSFKSLKQFHPSNWKNYSVRSICFSRNGKIMIVSGYLPVLAVFQLDIWKLLKIINLPEYINTVRKIQFVPQNFDGGCNKLLAILSGNGIIYFYNINENMLISQLKTKSEIIKFNMSSTNVSYISCLLRSGEVELYDINFYTMKNTSTVVEKAQDINDKNGLKPKLKNFCRKMDVNAKREIAKILEIDKLKAVVREYREFPDAFRATIWEKVLKLPNNIRQYNSIVNHVTVVAFNDLYKQFPLEDKVAIQCLKHVLNNIVTWCQFFAHVSFLPYFLFPFVKVFHKKPVACFEFCCTIIMNWCQHWFEYFPLPPVNVLAIIDNMLIEHDGELLKYFSENKVKPILYSWSLLETAFSEVLTAPEWLKFWDHVFINEPAFLLSAVVAYNILQRKHLIILNKEDQFNQFFHSQNPLDIRKFINKTYYILERTSEKNHPRQYLNMFTCLTCGSYPLFEEYPRDVISFQAEHINFLENQVKEMNGLKETMLQDLRNYDTYNDINIQNEEDRRQIEVEKACIQKIKTYQEALQSQQDQLRAIRLELQNQEKKYIDITQKNLKKHKTEVNVGTMEILMDGLDMGEKMNETELLKLQETYRHEQAELLRKKQKLEDPPKSAGPSPELTNELLSAHQNTACLKSQIRKARIELESPRKAKVAVTVTTLNNLIDKIRKELDRERNYTNYSSIKDNLKVHQLEKETRALQKQITQLLGLLARSSEMNGTATLSSQCPNKFERVTGTTKNKTVKFCNSRNHS